MASDEQEPLQSAGVGLGRGFTTILALILFALLRVTAAAGERGTGRPTGKERPFAYSHEEVADIPWSVHIFKFRRDHPELSFTTTLGGSNNVLGMSPVSAQLRRLKHENGTPIAAINGDFYNDHGPLPGDPRDLQVWRGELVSAPAGHSCFWLDPSGRPHCTNVASLFTLIWPNGATNSFGLNEARTEDRPVLYTAVTGAATPGGEGTEWVLEDAGQGGWLPLKIASTYIARVRASRPCGGPVEPGTMVLSLSPEQLTKTPKVKAGDLLRLNTASSPNLAGVTMAIGGGPALLRDGKLMDWPGIRMRHPRSAVGWNRDYFFLVEVDGRQPNLSVGMTFPELAAYLLKVGCTDAMGLDGGGSATLWVLGNVMNSPSEGRERPGANSLVVLQSTHPHP